MLHATEITSPDLGIATALRDCQPKMSVAELRASPDCIKLLDRKGRIVFMSANGLCAMQIPDHAMVAGQIWWDLWPEAERGKIRTALKLALTGEVALFEGHCPTMGGEMRHWRVEVKPVLGPRGAIETLLATSRDIT